jgi:hypothetical protein
MTMSANPLSEQVRGKTFRLIWTEGPTKGTAHDHEFHEDGTVEWKKPPPAGAPPKKASKAKKVAKRAPRKAVVESNTARYMAADVGEHVCLVSYLAQSGFTLTVALNMLSGSVTGVASNEKSWLPVKGTFEAVV